MEILKMLFVINLLVLLPEIVHCANTYNVGDPVPFFVNKIGPLHNPSETYQYYELPFCHPEHVVQKKEIFGEVLNGDRMATALYKLEFAANKTEATLCHKKLNRDSVAKFRDAIKNDFYYQMYYDDLPVWAFVGKVEGESWTANSKGPKYFLFTHVHFDALYNGNQVIEIHAFANPIRVVDVTEDADLDVDFTYSVSWNETSMLYKNRMDRYSRVSLFPILQKTHWFSFANSVVTVILLMGLLTVLFTRHLKNDLRKWSIGEDEEEEAGRKYIHGHMLRSPSNLPLLSAVIGSGTQLLAMVFILFLLAFLGAIYPYSRGSLSSFTFAAYILTSAISSYTSASFCSQYVETGWKRSAVLSGVLFLVPFITVSFFLNTLAAYSGTTAALPLGTIFLIILVYVLVSIPLLVLGGVVGHHHKSNLQPSSITKRHPRDVPLSLVWYHKIPAQMFIAGLLPFSAVIIQLQNVCATVWGYKIYASPGILFATFTMLVVITALLSIGLTYFQLAGDNHDWRWRSIFRGGSTAIFMFSYCVYFYLKSNMTGLLQASFFYGYSACMCYAFFLMLGTISYQASSVFVRCVYHTSKRE